MSGRRKVCMLCVAALAVVAAGEVLGQRAWTGPRSRPGAAGPPSDERAAAGQDPVPDTALRLLEILERNPQRGTAFDRVYESFFESGRLEDLIDRYRRRADANPRDATAWMILGQIEARRGRDSEATAAFEKAEAADPANYRASFYLGQSLMLAGHVDRAAEALERAIARRPAASDLSEIIQTLGRVYQRSGQNERALATFQRLERFFPGDERVQEEIAGVLVEERQYVEAMNRYERLAQGAGDRPEKQVQYWMTVAELKMRLERTREAIADLERLLDRLRPDSWLYRQARHRIESVFRQKSDLAGLTDYYSHWLGEHSEDLQAMALLAQVLGEQGRFGEAEGWLERAIKRASGSVDLRIAYLQQLIAQHKFHEAAQQYGELVSIEPNNPDHLRQWGLVILKDPSLESTERKQVATQVWQRLAQLRPRDPAMIVQVAELMRRAEMPSEAIELYQRAIDLAPRAAEYREYLGEYYHTLGRTADAMATWRGMIEGNHARVEDFHRFAEIVSSFGYEQEALLAAREAAKRAGNDLALRLAYADLLAQSQRHAEALVELETAGRLASGEEEYDHVIQKEIRSLAALGNLRQRAAALAGELDAGREPSCRRWCRLARYWQTLGDVRAGSAAAARAIDCDGRSLLACRLSTELHEQAGFLVEACRAYHRLATLDPKSRSEDLGNIARLEARLGRADEALQAARELVAVAPGQLKACRLLADLCFQFGREQEGLDALRRGARSNPADTRFLMAVADTLDRSSRTGEAIEIYWQIFRQSSDLDEKLGVVTRLARLHLQSMQFDRFVEELRRFRRRSEAPRDLALALAQAYVEAFDYASARAELESLLGAGGHDLILLRRLSSLAELQGDLPSAADYQARLFQLTGDDQDKCRLAELDLKLGRNDEARKAWSSLPASKRTTRELIGLVDQLLASNQPAGALDLARQLLRHDPSRWELVYREASALAGAGRLAEAKARFESLLNMPMSEDSASIVVRSRQPLEDWQSSSAAARMAARVAAADSIARRVLPERGAMALLNGSGAPAPELEANGFKECISVPQDFGQARIGALAWLLRMAQEERAEPQLLARYASLPGGERRDWRKVRDAYYLQLVRGNRQAVYQASQAIAAGGDPGACWACLESLTRWRGEDASCRDPAQPERQAPPAPLSDHELELLGNCFEELYRQDPASLTAPLIQTLLDELRRGGRKADFEKIYRQSVETPSQPEAIRVALELAARQGDVERLAELATRLAACQGTGRPMWEIATALSIGMARSAAQGDATRSLRLYEHYLELFATRRQQRPQTDSSGAAPEPRTSVYTIFIPSGGRLTQRAVTLDRPLPCSVLDRGSILLLRQVYELHGHAGQLREMFAYMTRWTKRQEGQGQVVALLSLGHLRWWYGDRLASVELLRRACDLSRPADPEILLDLAVRQYELNDRAGALATLKDVSPPDCQALKRREMLALNCAALSGDSRRAREAVTQLMQLQLTVPEETFLAARLQSLEMSATADALLKRAQCQSNASCVQLLDVLRECQRQKQADRTVDVANEILRRAAGSLSPETASAREESLVALKTSGKLAGLIVRAEEQLKLGAPSLELVNTLAAYYDAAGQPDKGRALYLQAAAGMAGDPEFHCRVAQSLSQKGASDMAVAHYQFALAGNPDSLARHLAEMAVNYHRVGRIQDLAERLSKYDLARLGSPHAAVQVLRTMCGDRAGNDGVELGRPAQLLASLWKAFPQERPLLAEQLIELQLAACPDLYEIARDALLLPAGFRRDRYPWAGADAGASFRRVDGTPFCSVFLSLLLDSAASRNKVDDLRKSIEQAVEREPGWLTGRAALAAIHLRTGNTAAAERLLVEILDDRNPPVPLHLCLALGQDLEKVPSLRGLLVRMYRKTRLREDSTLFGRSVARRLMEIACEDGRREEAREMAMGLLWPVPPVTPGTQFPCPEVNHDCAIARQLVRMGFLTDAYRVYSHLAELGDSLLPDDAHASEHMAVIRLERRQLERSLAPQMVLELLAGLPDRPADPTGTRPAAWMRTNIHPVLVTGAGSSVGISNIIVRVLRSCPRDPALGPQAKARLDRLARAHPDDLSVLIASAVFELASGPRGDPEPPVRRLVELIERRPMVDWHRSVELNSQQRRDLAEQVALWFVASPCVDRPHLRPYGEKLMRRAIQAAWQYRDRTMALVLLARLSPQDLQESDREAARTAIRDILRVQLGRVDGAGRARIGYWTSAEQFRYIGRLAFCTLQFTHAEQSLQCIREALSGGPPHPFEPHPRPEASAYIGVERSEVPACRVISQRAPNAEQGISTVVEQVLRDLDAQWTRHNVPSVAVYQTLASVVLPEGSPGDVFLYPGHLSLDSPLPRHVGILLARRAVESGKVDDLRARLSSRRRGPGSELAAHVLLVQLGIETHDKKLIQTSLARIEDLFQSQASTESARLAILAGLSVQVDPATHGAAQSLIRHGARYLEDWGRSEDHEAEPPRFTISEGFRE